MPEQLSIFTAAQISAALGVKRQSVQARLAVCAPSGTVIVRGVAVDAWTVNSLPGAMRADLDAVAHRGTWRNAEAMLLNPAKPWEPSIPLAQVAAHCLERAAKLQRALLPALTTHANDPAMSAAEFERLGVGDYAREFGHAISARHWRNLHRRTIERDGGREDWARLELYLDENPARKPEARPMPAVATAAKFEDLRQVIAAFNNPASPSEENQAYLWLRSFEAYEDCLAKGDTARHAKRGLLDFLFKFAPFLAASANALRVAFEYKYAKWLACDRDAKALRDARKDRPAAAKPELLKEDRDKIIGHAVINCGGRLSQAWRELTRDGQLSENVLGRYTATPASKSYVPHSVRSAVKSEVAMLEDIHHGPKQTKLLGASIRRDWSGVHAGDWWQADDITLPVYFWVLDAREKCGYRLTRGQCLLFIDLRTTRILHFVLIPEKQYNARAIRSCITKLCDTYGLPRHGFYFERGIWQSSRLLKGDSQAGSADWSETELGLRELGLKFTHAQQAKSKPVERVIGAIQNLMEGELGYCGRNEMVEKFEALQRAKLDVVTGNVAPWEKFLSFEQWTERLVEICEVYNADKQDGEMTGGLSPNEAFEQFQDRSNPQTRLDARCRFLLSDHKSPVTVSKNGIRLQFGNQVFIYRNEDTGRLIGQKVLAWFNPETPEILTVTDMNRRSPFTVERAIDVPAMDATASEMAAAQASVNAHNAYAKERYRTLRPLFAPQFRRNLVSPEIASLGREMTRQQKAASESRQANQSLAARVRRKAQQLGMPLNLVSERPEISDEGMDMMQEGERLHKLSQTQTPHD